MEYKKINKGIESIDKYRFSPERLIEAIKLLYDHMPSGYKEDAINLLLNLGFVDSEEEAARLWKVLEIIGFVITPEGYCKSVFSVTEKAKKYLFGSLGYLIIEFCDSLEKSSSKIKFVTIKILEQLKKVLI